MEIPSSSICMYFNKSTLLCCFCFVVDIIKPPKQCIPQLISSMSGQQTRASPCILFSNFTSLYLLYHPRSWVYHEGCYAAPLRVEKVRRHCERRRGREAPRL